MGDGKNLQGWQEDGDLECMQAFFGALGPDSVTAERVKKLTLQKLETKRTGKKFSRPKIHWKMWLKYGCTAAVLLLAIIGLADLAQSGLLINKSALISSPGGGQSSAPTPAVAPEEMAGMDMMADVSYSSINDQLETFSYRDSAQMDEEGQDTGADSAASKIIYTLDASLKVSSVMDTLQALGNAVQDMGGYVANSRQENTDYRLYAYLTLRIPAENFQSFDENLSQWGTVTDRYMYTDDVTEHYLDTEGRLKVWQAQEDRYVDLLQRAETVEDVLQIEDALVRVRQEKESLQGQLKYWDSKINYSEVRLTLTPLTNDVAVTNPWQPVSFKNSLIAAKNAVVKTISAGWNGFNYLLIGLGYALPVLAVVLVIFLIVRKRRKKAKSKV